jgi:hypothetical protein
MLILNTETPIPEFRKGTPRNNWLDARNLSFTLVVWLMLDLCFFARNLRRCGCDGKWGTFGQSMIYLASVATGRSHINSMTYL